MNIKVIYAKKPEGNSVELFQNWKNIQQEEKHRGNAEVACTNMNCKHNKPFTTNAYHIVNAVPKNTVLCEGENSFVVPLCDFCSILGKDSNTYEELVILHEDLVLLEKCLSPSDYTKPHKVELQKAIRRSQEETGNSLPPFPTSF